MSFLQLADEKKTPETVQLEFFFGPSYFEAALGIHSFLRLTFCWIEFMSTRCTGLGHTNGAYG